MILRLIALAIPLLVSALPATGPTHPEGDGGRADSAVLSRASLQLRHGSDSAVLRWLRRQTRVSSAGLGRDGKTLDIRFRDGIEGAVLPPMTHGVPVPSVTRPPLRAHQAEGSGRALVLEPFAGELYLGPNAGDAEASSLQSAGFSVDRATDEGVTVDTMAHLSGYNVVYILTHSGVNAAGEGVISTGEVANGDPSVQPYLDDRTVLIVGVAGTAYKFYGVLSGFFRTHVGDFPRDSLIFVNGCSMLRASLVWTALSARNVSTMVSWDNEAMQKEDVAASALFFDSMAHGKSVAGALADVYAAGHGRSTVDGTVASMGYLGSPDLTLHDVLYPPTTTPVPTETPVATEPPPPTSTPAPSSTRTAMKWHPWPQPLPLSTALAAGAHH